MNKLDIIQFNALPLSELAWATTRTVFPNLISGMILFIRRGRVLSIVSCRDSERGMHSGSRSLKGQKVKVKEMLKEKVME